MGSHATNPNTEAVAASTELEKAVLGGILFDAEVLPAASALLDIEDFYVPHHQRIYRAILEAQSEGIPIQFVPIYDKIGDLAFEIFISLSEHALPGCIEYLCRRLREYARRRRAQQAMIESIGALSSPGADLSEQFAYLSSDFLRLLDPGTQSTALDRQLIDTMKQIESGQDEQVIKTGFSGVDQELGGMHIAEMWIVAGRPGMGKSSYALNLVYRAAKLGASCVYVVVEGTARAQHYRLLSIDTGIDSRRIRTGQMSDSEFLQLVNSAGKLAQLPIQFFDGETRWSRIRSYLQNAKLKDPSMAVVVLDYVGLIACPEGGRERRQQLEFLSADFKRLACSLKLCFVMLAQLNREPDNRSNHRPKISDLRETGAFEQDADVILFPYRDWVYNKKSDVNSTEMCISKNREGPTGVLEMSFEPECVRFSDKYGKMLKQQDFD